MLGGNIGSTDKCTRKPCLKEGPPERECAQGWWKVADCDWSKVTQRRQQGILHHKGRQAGTVGAEVTQRAGRQEQASVEEA